MVLHCCPYCTYTTVWTTHLKNHVRIHTDERPYACDQCDATFRDHAALKHHLVTHLDVKPFACGLCAQRFAQKHHVQRHEAGCGRHHVKVREERVLSFLESTGLEFRREVVVWFDRSQRRFARVDFVLPFDDRLVYVEVDEHQHADYDQRRDLERTWHLFETCPKPLHLIRLNPDPFTVNGRRHKMFWSQRMELLLEVIQAKVWGVSYICYDNALKLTVPLAIIMLLALSIQRSAGPARL